MNNSIISELIGIDKTSIHNFDMFLTQEPDSNDNHIAFSYADTSSINALDTSNGSKIGKLTITDKEFGKLTFDTNSRRTTKRIDMSIASQNNLRPLNVGRYKRRINEVFDYISKKYNMNINYNFADMRLSYIEINATLLLEKKFSEYEIVLLLMVYNIPSNIYLNFEQHNGNKIYQFNEIIKETNGFKKSIETIGAKRSDRQIVMYNKTKELKDKCILNINGDYLRIEYKFSKHDHIINTHLGSNIDSLSDDNIHDLYMDYFNREIYYPMQEWKKANYENIKDKISKLCDSNGNMLKNWLSLLIQDIEGDLKNGIFGTILSDKDIQKILRELKKRNIKRTLNRARSVLQNKIYYDTDLYEKIDEIIETIHNS